MSERYFIHEPCWKTSFFATEAEWRKAMDDFDFLGGYCDDGWSEEVNNVVAGIVPEGSKRLDEDEDDDDFFERHATHRATKCDVHERPDDVDDDGYSPSQETYWYGDWDFICSYEFAPLAAKEAA